MGKNSTINSVLFDIPDEHKILMSKLKKFYREKKMNQGLCQM